MFVSVSAYILEFLVYILDVQAHIDSLYPKKKPIENFAD